MPKGVTKLLSDGAAKRKDPGVAMPKGGTGKAPASGADPKPGGSISRPNAANTRARAAGSLLDRLPKMPKGKKK